MWRNLKFVHICHLDKFLRMVMVMMTTMMLMTMITTMMLMTTLVVCADNRHHIELLRKAIKMMITVKIAMIML